MNEEDISLSPIHCKPARRLEMTYTVQYMRSQIMDNVNLKGLSHEIFGPVYWPVWMHLGLNENRFWFLNFEEAPSI